MYFVAVAVFKANVTNNDILGSTNLHINLSNGGLFERKRFHINRCIIIPINIVHSPFIPSGFRFFDDFSMGFQTFFLFQSDLQIGFIEFVVAPLALAMVWMRNWLDQILLLFNSSSPRFRKSYKGRIDTNSIQ